MKMFSKQFPIKRTNSHGHTTITAGSNLFCQKSSFHFPKKTTSFKEGRSRAIGRLRACFVAHHRLLGHQEENVEIERVRQFWEAEQRSHEKHFWKTKL